MTQHKKAVAVGGGSAEEVIVTVAEGTKEAMEQIVLDVFTHFMGHEYTKSERKAIIDFYTALTNAFSTIEVGAMSLDDIPKEMVDWAKRVLKRNEEE